MTKKLFFMIGAALLTGGLGFYLLSLTPLQSVFLAILAGIPFVLISSRSNIPVVSSPKKMEGPSVLTDEYRLLEKKFKAVSEKAEKLEYEKKTTEMFLASMSHEIRTPLNGIIGLTEVLDGTELSKEQKEYVSMIRESSNNLRVIVNDVLEVSKLNAGKMELENIPFDLAFKVKASVGLFMPKIEEKEIALNTFVDPKILQKIIADPTRLSQVLNNLISNALKFTPKGGKIDVAAELIGREGDDVTLKISVSDSGIGLSKAQQEKIFEAYSQATVSTTRKSGGTGLGLTISKKIIRSMGGELAVESEEGKGATFFFVITVKEAPAEAVEPEVLPEEIAETPVEEVKVEVPAGELQVLVAEDNPINQKLIQIILEKLGLKVTLADNGEKALEARKADRYDMIFMDIQMPVMGGVEATHAILDYEKEQGLKHIPIIALTANALSGDREKYMNEGMDDYTTKPLDVKAIEELVDKYCRS
ncbi:ATP-binding protein [Sulfurovum lithotrophicum]|uniref:ATP-binding protein n=1 Tax=Sulfurovum lithotrophicum TaxID=206403 RepID=UPI000697E2E3|nr:ATP-binding protein [Sulfurovum lithotrophicum]